MNRFKYGEEQTSKCLLKVILDALLRVTRQADLGEGPEQGGVGGLFWVEKEEMIEGIREKSQQGK